MDIKNKEHNEAFVRMQRIGINRNMSINSNESKIDKIKIKTPVSEMLYWLDAEDYGPLIYNERHS